MRTVAICALLSVVLVVLLTRQPDMTSRHAPLDPDTESQDHATSRQRSLDSGREAEPGGQLRELASEPDAANHVEDQLPGEEASQDTLTVEESALERRLAQLKMLQTVYNARLVARSIVVVELTRDGAYFEIVEESFSTKDFDIPEGHNYFVRSGSGHVRLFTVSPERFPEFKKIDEESEGAARYYGRDMISDDLALALVQRAEYLLTSVR